MAIRSVKITVSNGTPVDLSLVLWAGPCQGSWTSGQPPQAIGSFGTASSTASWETDDQGWFRGTESWVKYETTNIDANCITELVYIHWDNPFVWDSNTKPIDWSVTTTDVLAPCQGDRGNWDSGGFTHGGTNPDSCTHELFGIYAGGNSVSGITWWDVVVNWPALLGLTEIGQGNINLEFTFGLRTKGSVGQTMRAAAAVLGPQDIGALARQHGQPSLRKLFHM